MSRSSRRLAFAAPFVLIAALPGCKHSSGGDDTTTTHNPPAQRHFAEWRVSMNGDTCAATDTTPDAPCPPDMACNPPPPIPIACPAGITPEGPMAAYQDIEGGPCVLVSDGLEIACPSWGEGE